MYSSYISVDGTWRSEGQTSNHQGRSMDAEFYTIVSAVTSRTDALAHDTHDLRHRDDDAVFSLRIHIVMSRYTYWHSSSVG